MAAALSMATLGSVLAYCTTVPLAVASASPVLRRAAELHRDGLHVASNVFAHDASDATRTPATPAVLVCRVWDGQAAMLARWWLLRDERAVSPRRDAAACVNGPEGDISVIGGRGRAPQTDLLDAPRRLRLHWSCAGEAQTSALEARHATPPCEDTASARLCAFSLGDIVSLGPSIDELVVERATLKATAGASREALLRPCGLRVLRLTAVCLRQPADVQSLVIANCATLCLIELAQMPSSLPAQLSLSACPRLVELSLPRPVSDTAAGPLTTNVPPIATSSHDSAPPPMHAPACAFASDTHMLRHLTTLNLSEWTLPLDLTSLGECVALRTINLNASSAVDRNVEELSRAGGLQSVLLAHTAVTSVRPLQHCRLLHTLQLAHSAVTSGGLAGLEQLGELVQIDLSHTPVTHVSVLAACPRLTALNLWESAITTEGIQGLERAPSLQHLLLGGTHVHSVSSLAASRTLEQLKVPASALDTAGLLGVEQIATLRVLSVAHTRVDNVCALRVCRQLHTLDLSSSCVNTAGILGLEKIPSLRTLLLSNTNVDDIRHLAASRSLQELHLQRCSLHGDDAVEKVGDMPRLRALLITGCELHSLDHLGSCAALRKLSLWSTHVASPCLAALATARRLRQLDLAGTRVDDLAPLLACRQLVTLTVSGTMVASVDGLQHLRCLRKLNLADTAVRSVSCLQTSPALTTLILSNTAVDDAGLAGLERVATLRELMLHATQVTQVGMLGRCFQLQVLVARQCPVTAAGLVGLETATGLVKLDLSYTHLRSGVTRLAGCRRLSKLNLTFTDVPLAEVRHLTAALPHCHILHDAAVRARKGIVLLAPADS